VLNQDEMNKTIQTFMHPTVFTGVKPLFLVAEELATQTQLGDIIDAVWVHWEDEDTREFSYITKFAVRGQILDRHYYSAEEMAPFKGRLALPEHDNLEKMMRHRLIKQEIEVVTAKRNALAKLIQKDFQDFSGLIEANEEVFVFKKGNGDWRDPFGEITIDSPYQIVLVEDEVLDEGEYRLKNLKTGVIKKYFLEEEFYAYIVGSSADITGLQLKDESYLKNIDTLKEQAREVLMSIEWLDLSDPRCKQLKDSLPRHPFEEYFNYVAKGKERKVEVPMRLVEALKGIIAQHMPKLNGPMGVEYIPIDNLLYLFHEVIPRAQALIALEVCDIVHEPSALLLGYEGRRELPPKFLISVEQVVYAYQGFSAFIEACEAYEKRD